MKIYEKLSFELSNILIILILLLLLISCSNQPAVYSSTNGYSTINSIKIASFNTIKGRNKNLNNMQQANKLANSIHSKHHHTFYCNCCYEGKVIDLNSCGYKIQRNKKRATRIEWEHIVPVSRLAKNLVCWNNPVCCNQNFCYKGRACCQKIDPYFIRLATDLHNIVPEIGELNAIRSNYEFAELLYMPFGQFGDCKVKIDRKHKKIEVDKKIKGIVARVYLYMNDTYNLNLNAKEKTLFNKWNRQYPPKSWEIDWNNKVNEVQYTKNKYISEYSKYAKK